MTEDQQDAPRTGLIAGQGKGLMIAVLAICGALILAIVILVSIVIAGRAEDLRRYAARLLTPAHSPEPVSVPISVPVSVDVPVARPAVSEPSVISGVRLPVEDYPQAMALATPDGNVADWFAQDSYSTETERPQEEGRVVVSLSIDPSGKPRKCYLVSSSGSASLDVKTCRLALRNGRFIAARDVHGDPVWSGYQMRPIRWQNGDGGSDIPPAPPPAAKRIQ